MPRSRSNGLHHEASGHGTVVVDGEDAAEGAGLIDALVPEPRILETEPVPGRMPVNLLLVDDKPENLKAMVALLEPLNERIVTATSGTDALRELLRDEFALILMDAEMPGMDGFETAEMIRHREKTRTVPIIFVTAYSYERKHMFRGYSVGAVDYIPKPFDPDVLRSKVQVFVDLFRKTQQIKTQAELLRRSQLREAEQEKRELQEQMERQHLETLNQELERRVTERTEELLAANKELEAFAYSVSHDLRAPLRAICATSEFLLRDATDRLTEDERENLEIQSLEARRLAKLIDNLLELSRLGRRALNRTHVDLSQMARAVYDEVKATVGDKAAKVKIQRRMTCDADPQLLRMVLFNLMENACKYSDDRCEITVGACQEGGKDVFFVRDTGIGFEMEYANKIFLPFERLVNDPKYGGTGIGLANVQRIVQRHGGRVWAKSEVGKGSTFYFTLS